MPPHYCCRVVYTPQSGAPPINMRGGGFYKPPRRSSGAAGSLLGNRSEKRRRSTKNQKSAGRAEKTERKNRLQVRYLRGPTCTTITHFVLHHVLALGFEIVWVLHVLHGGGGAGKWMEVQSRDERCKRGRQGGRGLGGGAGGIVIHHGRWPLLTAIGSLLQQKQKLLILGQTGHREIYTTNATPPQKPTLTSARHGMAVPRLTGVWTKTKTATKLATLEVLDDTRRYSGRQARK